MKKLINKIKFMIDFSRLVMAPFIAALFFVGLGYLIPDIKIFAFAVCGITFIGIIYLYVVIYKLSVNLSDYLKEFEVKKWVSEVPSDFDRRMNIWKSEGTNGVILSQNLFIPFTTLSMVMGVGLNPNAIFNSYGILVGMAPNPDGSYNVDSFQIDDFKDYNDPLSAVSQSVEFSNQLMGQSSSGFDSVSYADSGSINSGSNGIM